MIKKFKIFERVKSDDFLKNLKSILKTYPFNSNYNYVLLKFNNKEEVKLILSICKKLNFSISSKNLIEDYFKSGMGLFLQNGNWFVLTGEEHFKGNQILAEYLLDPETIKKLKKEKEEKKLKMLDIDPFGEEDWD